MRSLFDKVVDYIEENDVSDIVTDVVELVDGSVSFVVDGVKFKLTEIADG